MVSSKYIYPCFALLRDSFTPKLTIYAISPLAALILKENTVELYATLSLHSQWNVIDYFLSLWWLDEWIVKTQTPILQLNIIINSFEGKLQWFLETFHNMSFTLHDADFVIFHQKKNTKKKHSDCKFLRLQNSMKSTRDPREISLGKIF